MHEAIPSGIQLEEKLSVRDVVSNLWVEGQDFSIAISKKDGSISAMNYQGVPILEHGPRINFFRPYTDNDLSSKENWSAHHLHAMEMNVYNLGYEKKKGSVVIKVEGRVGARGLSWGSKVVMLYTISQGGYVDISLEGSFSEDAPSYVPKIGLQLLMNKEFSSVTYQGYGPGECYSDSKEYAVKGIHTMPCNQMSFPYLTPQENGNRTEVTWASLMHTNQKLFFQFAASEMDFSIRDVTDMELYKKNHIDELETAPYLIVNCDMINSGLGSQSCGPDRLEKYQAQTQKPYSFLLKMRPVSVELTKDNMKKQKYEIEEARNLWEIKV